MFLCRRRCKGTRMSWGFRFHFRVLKSLFLQEWPWERRSRSPGCLWPWKRLRMILLPASLEARRRSGGPLLSHSYLYTDKYLQLAQRPASPLISLCASWELCSRKPKMCTWFIFWINELSRFDFQICCNESLGDLTRRASRCQTSWCSIEQHSDSSLNEGEKKQR